ncbi:ThiF family adenylyltransferase [Amycolatopsis acidiphila]|uniref:ThiF family adenylyltransferase n=1 Tax=Amycolatopsis acidiphila TaxID=715473 RepID=UPI001C983222|nr:ThiF family adenylyltransferase [Amycolatopsis acidiphila]UIJ63473.1 ThiF family adenylyltransferase [Amycolatopsis acidiphila]
MGAIIALSIGNGPVIPTPLEPKNHFLCSGDTCSGQLWYRADPDLHAMWWNARRLNKACQLEAFKNCIAGGWRNPPSTGSYLALTFSPDAPAKFPDVDITEFAAWLVTAEGVTPVAVEVQSSKVGMAQLSATWPTKTMSEISVLVIGLGSIGGAAAHALAEYGVGTLRLLDPDRLLAHNLVRHVGPPEGVGRLKVDVIKQQLAALRADTVVETHPWDVIESAHLVRGLLLSVDLVLCAADGVAARRVVSHLARRAKKDAVLACVLADGSFGEVIRLRPWHDHGCLVCRRATLADKGGIDPEPGLDAGYGTGTTHRPMTAVGGDLHLLGRLAAKTAVATVLERRGHTDQKLPGEHLLLALRPEIGWAPPFDLTRNGETRWLPHTPPRPGCPTCEPA